MRKILLAALLALALLAALFIRVQPSGQASVFRRGRSLATRTSPVYLRPLLGGQRCRTSAFDGHLLFDSNLTGLTAASDEVPLRIRFTYDPPETVAADWPDGDWCDSLESRLRAYAAQAASHETIATLLADRRSAGERVAAILSAKLADSGVRATGVSARIDISAESERLRGVADVAIHARAARPVIFIGLDGADWQLLDEYIADGTMPNLARVVRTGTAGVLETDYPPLSPLVWTTMMTGAGPLDHGILDFTRFNPYSHEKEPITSDERRVPAIWNMLTYAGKQTAVFGLWATYAAEPVHGLNVSDRLFTFLYTESETPAGVVWPPTRQKWSADTLARAEAAVDAARVRDYLPALTDSEFDALTKNKNPYADPPAALRRILLETEVYRRLSDDYLSRRPALPDLTILYLQGTDTIGHVFAPFAPPRQEAVSQADFDRYHAIPAHYFRDIDALLGSYLSLAQRNNAIVMIASDHGFYWREGRPTAISSTATATAAKWHRKEGIYALWGAGIGAQAGHPLRGSVRQVCATLLALTGMPAPAGAQPPLPGAPAAAGTLDYRPYFQRAASPPPPASGRAASEDIAKLKALGYIGSNESTRSASATSGDTRTAGAFNNEGLILRNEHRTDDALAAFDHALAIDPKYASAMWNESETLFDAGRDLDRADQLLIDALANGLNDAGTYVVTRTIAYERTGRASRNLPLLNAAVTAAPNDAAIRMFRGRYRMDSHDCNGALDDFRAAETAQPRNALTFASAAVAELCLGDETAARASIERSLQLDPNQPVLRRMLAQ